VHKIGFADIELAWLQPRTAGNFLYLRQDGETWIVLFIGNCDDLLIKARERWSEAMNQHGATHIHIRRVVTSRVRQEEQVDILQAYEPAMNVDEALTRGTDPRQIPKTAPSRQSRRPEKRTF
jgi:hypothetical protein